MSGSDSKPSHKCPFIHAFARPTRHVGTRLRAPSAAAKIMNPNPTTPKNNPIALPPRAPNGEIHISNRYTATAAEKIPSDPIAHPRCVRSSCIQYPFPCSPVLSFRVRRGGRGICFSLLLCVLCALCVKTKQSNNLSTQTIRYSSSTTRYLIYP